MVRGIGRQQRGGGSRGGRGRRGGGGSRSRRTSGPRHREIQFESVDQTLLGMQMEWDRGTSGRTGCPRHREIQFESVEQTVLGLQLEWLLSQRIQHQQARGHSPHGSFSGVGGPAPLRPLSQGAQQQPQQTRSATASSFPQPRSGNAGTIQRVIPPGQGHYSNYTQNQQSQPHSETLSSSHQLSHEVPTRPVSQTQMSAASLGPSSHQEQVQQSLSQPILGGQPVFRSPLAKESPSCHSAPNQEGIIDLNSGSGSNDSSASSSSTSSVSVKDQSGEPMGLQKTMKKVSKAVKRKYEELANTDSVLLSPEEVVQKTSELSVPVNARKPSPPTSPTYLCVAPSVGPEAIQVPGSNPPEPVSSETCSQPGYDKISEPIGVGVVDESMELGASSEASPNTGIETCRENVVTIEEKAEESKSDEEGETGETVRDIHGMTPTVQVTTINEEAEGAHETAYEGSTVDESIESRTPNPAQAAEMEEDADTNFQRRRFNFALAAARTYLENP